MRENEGKGLREVRYCSGAEERLQSEVRRFVEDSVTSKSV